jgi:hypothetical protein
LHSNTPLERESARRSCLLAWNSWRPCAARRGACGSLSTHSSSPPQQLLGLARFLASTASSYQASAMSHRPTIIQEAGREETVRNPTRALFLHMSSPPHFLASTASSYQHLLTIKHQPSTIEMTLSLMSLMSLMSPTGWTCGEVGGRRWEPRTNASKCTCGPQAPSRQAPRPVSKLSPLGQQCSHDDHDIVTLPL